MRQHEIEEDEAGREMPVDIDRESCNACGICGKTCPMQIFKHACEKGIVFRTDRLALCIKCGQCMAVCSSQSIAVNSLDYSRDFFAIPKGPVAEMPFLEMIKTRRAIRVFKDRPVPKELLEKVVQAITCAPPGFTPIKAEVVVVRGKLFSIPDGNVVVALMILGYPMYRYPRGIKRSLKSVKWISDLCR